MTTVGYSGTPLPAKLGIRAGARLALLHAPAGFGAALGELPPGVEFVDPDDGALDVAVLFVTERAELQRSFAAVAARLVPNGGLWVAWPKRASGASTDLTENVAREIGLRAGLVDNKVCAIDATWSGLRFVYRLKDRRT
jgi:hypothetical protein